MSAGGVVSGPSSIRRCVQTLTSEIMDAEILAEMLRRQEVLTKADQLPLPEKKATRNRAAKKTSTPTPPNADMGNTPTNTQNRLLPTPLTHKPGITRKLPLGSSMTPRPQLGITTPNGCIFSAAPRLIRRPPC